jgi:carbon storage regulator CsrA
MLVLSRKETERVVIGDDIVITIVRVAGSKVRIGIEAPRGVSIRREELAPVKANASEQPTKVGFRGLDSTVESEAVWPSGL